jgi:hypothetical protein
MDNDVKAQISAEMLEAILKKMKDTSELALKKIQDDLTRDRSVGMLMSVICYPDQAIYAYVIEHLIKDIENIKSRVPTELWVQECANYLFASILRGTRETTINEDGYIFARKKEVRLREEAILLELIIGSSSEP